MWKRPAFVNHLALANQLSHRQRQQRNHLSKLVFEALEKRQLLAFGVLDTYCEPMDPLNAVQPAAIYSDPTPQDTDYHDDGFLRRDDRGLAFYHDPAPADLPEQSLPIDDHGPKEGDRPGSAPRALNVPVYHSLPSATKKIYLDFDGQMVSNTIWNNQNYTGSYNTGPVITAPAFSLDSDLENYSADELTRIRNIWARVAEDYAPFNVDVTTEDPGVAKFTAGSQGIRVIISTDIDQISGSRWYPSAGGVAYLNSWTWTSDTPVWVFYNRLGPGNEKYVAEAASHEVGHAFNLRHDGRTSPSEGYYQGHGSGTTAWAPIMGVGYYRPFVQWSKGEYTSANQTEDDLQIISSKIPHVTDDHGNNSSNATELNVASNGSVSASGLITTRTDVDAFSFITQTGNVVLDFTPFEASTGKGNLDIQVTLVDDQNQVVTVVNPVNLITASVAVNLQKGRYTTIVDGVGRAAIAGDEGYSDYASIGAYSLSGTVIPNHAPISVDDTAATLVGTDVLIDVLGNDIDADSDTLTILSIGSVANGMASIVDDKIIYTPNLDFAGHETFSYVVSDGLEGWDTGQVSVDVVVPRRVEDILVGSGNQRSIIEQVVVTFDGEVNIGADAFIVNKQGTNGGPVGVQFSSELAGGKTIATLQFSGALVDNGSLTDGNYELLISGSLVTDSYGNSLDGDGDGTAGGDYTFGSSQADNFFRLFGDASGDRQVSLVDFNQMRSSFGKALGDAGYLDAFDYDNNDAINLVDFNQFRQRFGTQI